MQIYARDHVEIQPKKKKEVIYLVKKKEKIITTEHYGYKVWSTIAKIKQTSTFHL